VKHQKLSSEQLSHAKNAQKSSTEGARAAQTQQNISNDIINFAVQSKTDIVNKMNADDSSLSPTTILDKKANSANDNNNSTTRVIISSSNSNAATPFNKSDVPSRCTQCSKKLNLTSIKCRCNLYFCSIHRYPESHNCTFDYRTHFSIKLQEQLVKPDSSKIVKLE